MPQALSPRPRGIAWVLPASLEHSTLISLRDWLIHVVLRVRIKYASSAH